MLIHTWNVLCFFPESIHSRIHNKTFALNASPLKCSYGALYQALNKPSVSDFIAAVEHEIRKVLAVLDSRHSLRKGLLGISSHQALLDEFNEEQVAHDHHCQEEKVQGW